MTIVNSPAPTQAPSRDAHQKSDSDSGLSGAESTSVIIGASVAGAAIVIAVITFMFLRYRKSTATKSVERNYNVELNVSVDAASSRAPKFEASAPPHATTASPMQHGAFSGEASSEDVKLDDKV